jgi:hypothetical protein
VLELKDWAKQSRFAEKPWLVLGKGPTFSRRNEFDLTAYNKFSLNHVVREVKVEVAQIVDIDVAESCAASLQKNCEFLLMPRVPNVRHFPGEYLTLADWCNCIPELAAMESQGRLVTYDFSHLDSDDPWTIVARYFSSEVALGVLGRMGVKNAFTLGIDGGTAYSQSFADIAKETLLANGQPSFDLQFGRLAELAQQLKLEFSPLISGASAATTATRQASAAALPDTTVSGTRAQTRTDYQPLILAQSDVSVPEKLQMMEQEIRQLRTNFYAAADDLQATSKELGIITDRLGWARDEIAEYQARVLELEKNMHTIVQSKTWKLGRVFTKPVEVLTKKTKQEI